jgi:serine/threonine-protein kinase
MSKDPYYGRLLANRYQLGELIGKGAMGRVYQAQDITLGGVIVAIKFLSQTVISKKARDRFEREAKISAQLGERSIHIIRVRDYGVDDVTETPFYVMEFLQGDSIRDVIKKEPLTLPRFLSLARQICLGLQSAHHGIFMDNKLYPVIHRDIKPSNILVVQDLSFGELVKVLDFGIAKLQAEEEATHSFKGTLAYCSPEQMEGKELDNRSDIYSLGVMMFEMLTGEIPLRADTHSFGSWYKVHHYQPPRSFESIDANFRFPKPIADMVMKCLAKAKDKRPQSINEILQIIETEIANKPTQVREAIEEKAPEKPPQIEPKKEPEKEKVKETKKVSQSIPATQATQPTRETLYLSIDDICHKASWPSDKPKAEIVFPHILRNHQEAVPSLWVMLSQGEIEARRLSNSYNPYKHFLFLPSPHPMMLWITALYNPQYGPRWLPCYLDLKSSMGQEITQLLEKTGNYRLLFFSIEKPERCAYVMNLTVPPKQRPMLLEWITTSRTMGASGQSKMSKRLLKEEFERLKPQVLRKLEVL